MLGIKEIQEIIPHRHPFLLIDCVEEIRPGEGAVGYKSVTYNEPFFAGHFPQEPVMPGPDCGSPGPGRRGSHPERGGEQGKGSLLRRN